MINVQEVLLRFNRIYGFVDMEAIASPIIRLLCELSESEPQLLTQPTIPLPITPPSNR
jgi:hypothetical protein